MGKPKVSHLSDQRAYIQFKCGQTYYERRRIRTHAIHSTRRGKVCPNLDTFLHVLSLVTHFNNRYEIYTEYMGNGNNRVYDE